MSEVHWTQRERLFFPDGLFHFVFISE